MPESSCQCECGHVRYSVSGPALLRGFCHCTICQEFNQAPFADISLFKASNVDFPASETVQYKAYKKLPPAVQRGKCAACQGVAIERLKLPLMPEIVVVPSANVMEASILPEPALHIFYHRRVADVQDSLPKYEGFMTSQWAFSHRLLKALMA